MEGNKLKELIENKNQNPKKQNKEKLIELINYYESCLDNINNLQVKTEVLYNKSNQNQENIKLFKDFYTEFFVPHSIENNDEDIKISKIEHFKNLYSDIVVKVSTLEKKSEDVDKAYENLHQIIQVKVGNTTENWSIAKYINLYVKNLSKISTYEKQLKDANESIEQYKEKIKELKLEFVNTKQDIQKLLNPAAAISLSNSYKETREKDYKKLSWAMGGYYILFLLPLVLILVYFLYPSIFGLNIISANRYIDNILRNISVVIPLSIISWFGLNSIKKNKHMHDEYNHKQRLMQTYIGFKGENDVDDSLLTKLNNIVIETVAENPNKKFSEEPTYIERITNSIKRSK